MTIHKLQINNIRNIQSVSLKPSEDINIFYGNNGAGKTTLLEAVHLLTHGRSFRASRHKSLILQGAQQATVFGTVGETETPVGIQKDIKNNTQIRIAGEKVSQVSELARLVPVQVINSDAFQLLEGSPRNRRQFLDWGVFHVEHGFIRAWSDLQKSLKNRNTLLRSGKMSDQLRDVWDKEFVTAANTIDRLRQKYLGEFKERFHLLLQQLVELDELTLSYYRGWDKTKTFEEVLTDSLRRDLNSGFSHYGPQRADLRIRKDKLNAADLLSRGQQKLVVSALKLAQAEDLISRKNHRRCVFLLDDLPAELDRQHLTQICQLLESMDAQVFISCIDPSSFDGIWKNQDRVKMFHVEHGALSGEMNE